MNTSLRIFLLSFTLFFGLNSLSEIVDSTEEPAVRQKKTTATNIKLNQMGDSHVELMGSLVSSSSAAFSINWVVTPKIIIGFQNQSYSTLRSSSGGDLDGGQYFSSTSGYSGRSAFIGGKYFFNDAGIQTRGWFTSAQLGRLWGKYEFSQNRYERENGFLGQLFGIDKKLAESSSSEKNGDADITRVSIGYIFPWLARYYFDGLSIQVQVGLENSSLQANQSLSTKFETRNLSDDVKSWAFGQVGFAAYF